MPKYIVSAVDDSKLRVLVQVGPWDGAVRGACDAAYFASDLFFGVDKDDTHRYSVGAEKNDDGTFTIDQVERFTGGTTKQSRVVNVREVTYTPRNIRVIKARG